MTQPTVRVTATGSARVTPDQVRIAVAVEATADTVGQALQQASEGVARLESVLDDAGVPPGDRSTSGLGVQPAWDRAGDRPQGHTASYGLQLVVHDLDAAGQLVQTAAEQVGDVLRVHGFGLTVRDPSVQVREARRLAVQACRDQAEQLADAAGARLGPLLSLVEGADRGEVQHHARASLAVSQSEAGLPVHAGDQQVVVAVTGTWALDVGAPGSA